MTSSSSSSGEDILALLDNNDEENDVENEPFFPGTDDDCGILQEEEIDSDHELEDTQEDNGEDEVRFVIASGHHMAWCYLMQNIILTLQLCQHQVVHTLCVQTDTCIHGQKWSMHHHPIVSKGDLFLVFHLIRPRHNGAGDKQVRINMLGWRIGVMDSSYHKWTMCLYGVHDTDGLHQAPFTTQLLEEGHGLLVPTNSWHKTKAFPLQLYCDIFYTFYSGLLSITALLTYANNEYPYTVWYLDKVHASTRRQWVTVSVACETHHVSPSFLQSRLWRLQFGTKSWSTSLHGDVFVDSAVQRRCPQPKEASKRSTCNSVHTVTFLFQH